MTSQELDIESLREEAAELGMKGVHLYKDPEKLAEKIAEHKAKAEPVRKKAPKMRVSGTGYTDYAMERLRQLEQEHPDRKYLIRAVGTPPEKLANQGLAFDGETIGDEMLCYTDRESYEEYIVAKNRAERRKMDAIDPVEDGKIKSFDAQPKKGIADPK